MNMGTPNVKTWRPSFRSSPAETDGWIGGNVVLSYGFMFFHIRSKREESSLKFYPPRIEGKISPERRICTVLAGNNHDFH